LIQFDDRIQGDISGLMYEFTELEWPVPFAIIEHWHVNLLEDTFFKDPRGGPQK